MEDLFYFTKDSVTLKELEKVAEEAGYLWKVVPGSNEPWLNVYYDSENFWQWIPISDQAGDFDSWEPDDRQIVRSFAPSSSFTIAYLPASWPMLREFLLRVLQLHDGWVGSDAAGWEPVYTRDTIRHKENPTYARTLAWLEGQEQRNA